MRERSSSTKRARIAAQLLMGTQLSDNKTKCVASLSASAAFISAKVARTSEIFPHAVGIVGTRRATLANQYPTAAGSFACKKIGNSSPASVKNSCQICGCNTSPRVRNMNAIFGCKEHAASSAPAHPISSLPVFMHTPPLSPPDLSAILLPPGSFLIFSQTLFRLAKAPFQNQSSPS